MLLHNRFCCKFLTVIILVLSLSGCNTAFHDLGIPPELSVPKSEIANNSSIENNTPMVVRGPDRIAMADNAIWNKRDGNYFRNRRAYAVGDILTVNISINDSAKFNNKSEKENSLSGSLKFAGTNTIPGISIPTIALEDSLKANTNLERDGATSRTEKINLQLAAIVINSSVNGNLQIQGSQEVRVNHELRILTVQGVVRAKDILPDNTIAFEKIAEARISYGGLNTRVAKNKRRRPRNFTKFHVNR